MQARAPVPALNTYTFLPSLSLFPSLSLSFYLCFISAHLAQIMGDR